MELLGNSIVSEKLDAMEKELNAFAVQIANAVRAHGGLTKKSDMTPAEAWELIKAFNAAATKPKPTDIVKSQETPSQNPQVRRLLELAAENPSKATMYFMKARRAALRERGFESFLKAHQSMNDEDRADLVKLAHEVGDARRKRLKLVGP